MQDHSWILAILFFAVPASAVQKLQERFKWSVIDYAFISNVDKVEAITSGRYIPENNYPLGIEVWKDKLFVSVPRWQPGVASTLNFVYLDSKTPPNPLLRPYPNWASTDPANCDTGLTNVHRIKADSCDRLWVLDTGTTGLTNTTQRFCPITLNVFDLNTNTCIRKYVLPADSIVDDTFIANVEIDEGCSCEDTFAYLSDELGYGLIVYSWEHNISWRFNHAYFRPDPLAYDFNVGGVNYQWEDEGIFGMSLSPKQTDGFKTLFFSPLTSKREFAVSTKVLKDPSKISDSHQEFIALPERGPNGHVTAKTMTRNGVQFFGAIDVNGVGCWNSRVHPYSVEFLGVSDKDDVKLIFPSDIRVDRGDNIWVVSNRLPLILYSRLDYDDVNFRVFWAPAKVLAQGTVCEDKRPFGGLIEEGGLRDKWFGTNFF